MTRPLCLALTAATAVLLSGCALWPGGKDASLAGFLTGDQIAENVVGSSFQTDRWEFAVQEDAQLVGRYQDQVDEGRWVIRGEQLCFDWSYWNTGSFNCYRIQQQGEDYLLYKNNLFRDRFRRRNLPLV